MPRRYSYSTENKQLRDRECPGGIVIPLRINSSGTGNVLHGNIVIPLRINSSGPVNAPEV
jgi:hypothetical protein